MTLKDTSQIAKNVITYSLGGITGLFLLDIFQSQNHLTWNKVLAIVVVSIIGSTIGIKLRKIKEESD